MSRTFQPERNTNRKRNTRGPCGLIEDVSIVTNKRMFELQFFSFSSFFLFSSHPCWHIESKRYSNETTSASTLAFSSIWFLVLNNMYKENTLTKLIRNAIHSLFMQTNTLEEITTSPSSSQASAIADILMTGNELMEMKESTTAAGIQTTGK